MSAVQTKRKMLSDDLINIVWLCLLALAVVVYWLYNLSLLSELVDIIRDAISEGLVIFSGTTANFVLLFIWLSAFRFFILIVADFAKKQLPKAVGNLTCCLMLAVTACLFDSWLRVTLSVYYALSILLFLIGLCKVAKGIANGLFRGNQRNVLNGDWRTILFGIRTMILAVLFTESNFLVFRDFVLLVSEMIGAPLMRGEFVADLSTFMILVLFVYILTEIPSRLIFTRCKRCKMLFLKIGVSESSWDSEHTLRHRHCPRCGATCF
ncbi:hypothetical protein KEJ18_04060 [Candidatus Bathyarchaeota archaeon]|nr:hypothetical protein [Candidatus Bathyarchaeota archaeon]